MSFINEIYKSKTFKGWFTEAELERAWQVILREKPYLKNVPVSKKKKNLGKWCCDQLATKKIPKVKAPESMKISYRLSEKGLNDNQVFFLKRRISDWASEHKGVLDVINDLLDEHNDAAKSPDCVKYCNDISELYKMFGLDISDNSIYN